MLLPTCGTSETTRRSKTEQEVRRKCLDIRRSCICHNKQTVAQRCQLDRRALDTQKGQDESRAFPLGQNMVTFCEVSSNHGRRARQTDRRSPGFHQRVENRLPRGVPHAFQYSSGEVPGVRLSLLMTQDPHNMLLQRERGGRETLCPTCDRRKPKHSRTLACHRQAP